MGRQRRVHYCGACYHVSVRGNSRLPIFFTVRDRQRFLCLVGEGVARYGHRVHAYCLMTNHAHFAIQVAEVPLGKIVHNICFRYSRFVNRRLDRSGHLFERRYRARLIDSANSLMRVVRYIHRNPVDAGMVEDAFSFPWSSHRAYMRPFAPRWLTTTMVLRLLHRNRRKARDLLREWVTGSQDEWVGPGRDRLLTEALHSHEVPARDIGLSLEAVVEAVAQVTSVDRAEILGGHLGRAATRARALVALIVRDHSNHSLRALGDFLGRDASSLSCAASRWERASADKLVALLRHERAALCLLRRVRDRSGGGKCKSAMTGTAAW